MQLCSIWILVWYVSCNEINLNIIIYRYWWYHGWILLTIHQFLFYFQCFNERSCGDCLTWRWIQTVHEYIICFKLTPSTKKQHECIEITENLIKVIVLKRYINFCFYCQIRTLSEIINDNYHLIISVIIIILQSTTQNKPIQLINFIKKKHKFNWISSHQSAPHQSYSDFQ